MLGYTFVGSKVSLILGQTPQITELKNADAIVVLGGDPSRAFAAGEVYQHGLASLVIVSADTDRLAYVLKLCGVPDERVLIEDDAKRTVDHPQTIQQFEGIGPKSRLILVTNRYHPARVRAIFRQAGYQSFQVYSIDYEWMLGKKSSMIGFVDANYILYELLAWLKWKTIG